MSENIREKIGDSRRELLERLLEQMEKGALPWYAPWNSALLRPQNPYTNVYYRGGNRMRLWDAAFRNDYDDPRWMTFTQIQKAGYELREAKGKGILLEHWRYTEVKEIENERGEKEKQEVDLPKPIPGFFYVFNARHIEGLPSLTLADREPTSLRDIGEGILRSSPCPIQERAINQAFYMLERDEITIPPKKFFDDPDQFYAVALHEMSHATGHPNRLRRETLARYHENHDWRAKEELRAELGSVFLRAELGIPLKEAAYTESGAYLKSWMRALKDAPEELFRAAADAEKISDYIMERYLDREKKKEDPSAQKTTKPKRKLSR